VIIVLVSCDKFEGDQVVPSYIRIEKFILKENPNLNYEEGILSHNIEDVWIYVDDQIIGAFELPAVIPVLQEGSHKLTLSPGILLNGMSGTRAAYPLIKPNINKAFNMFVDSVIVVEPEIEYYDHAVFSVVEDFEDEFYYLQETDDSDTIIDILVHSIPGFPLGSRSGLITLDNSKTIFECATNVGEPEGIVLPGGTSPVFLELDYNTNNEITVGLYVNYFTGDVIQRPVVIINPSGGVWKKIYVNFTPAVTDTQDALDYNVFIGVNKSSDVDYPVVMIDNIKLVSIKYN